ncbi:MAG TPA: AgmX/PglI C-terminal domain-containing protein, partial [Polyangiaceae bacterium]
PMQIEALSKALKTSAAQKHPTDGLVAVFAFGADATADVVKSVLHTVAVAGYPHARLVVRTASGIGYFDVDARDASDLPGSSTANGRLAPELIQRIVRSHFGDFKRCFEVALRTAPGLRGTVRVKFVIGLDGHVSSAADSGASTLPDPTVVACVAHAFESIEFPSPEGGVVTVVYPIIFSPRGAP